MKDTDTSNHLYLDHVIVISLLSSNQVSPFKINEVEDLHRDTTY